MIDKEKDLRLNDLLKKIVNISKLMPEIVFTYFSTFEKEKTYKCFYNLICESFLNLFSFAFLYLNKAWSQASSLLRTSIEQVSKVVVLSENEKVIPEFIKRRKIMETYHRISRFEDCEQFLKQFNGDIQVFNYYTEYGWADSLFETQPVTKKDVITKAGFGDTLTDIRNTLNSFVHGSLSIFDFYTESNNTEIMKRYGRRIALIACKLFYSLYIAFKNWKLAKDISFESDNMFLEFKALYKDLIANY